ncbi:TPA: hypothetical protein OMS42_002021 [Enterobacter kobei]|nr:hypothetical protein [Enterobacter kobei]
MTTKEDKDMYDMYAEQKKQALLEVAVKLAGTPGVDADQISYTVQKLKETLNDIVFKN